MVWNTSESLSSTGFNQVYFLKMSAQKRRKLHRLFGRSTTAVPDLTAPLSQTSQSTPPPPSARCGSLTAAFLHSMCQVFFIWVHFRFTGVDLVCRRRRFCAPSSPSCLVFQKLWLQRLKKRSENLVVFVSRRGIYRQMCNRVWFTFSFTWWFRTASLNVPNVL